ncbi:MAG: IPT/TIG domain-containing protein, partial [bacterium]|nr:IPT/TIG domain-containing protein [bacterium]
MLQKIKKLIVFISLALVIFTMANFALAADVVDVGLEAAAGTGLGATDPRVIAANIIRIILGFLGILAVCLVIYAGWLWMTAEGEAEKVAKAKKILIGAVIGLVICLASFAIASFVLNSLLDATGVGTGNTGGSGGGIGTSGGGTTGGLPGEGKSCLKDLLDTRCAAGRCAAGLSCSSSDCLCHETNQPGEGESCDADTNLAGCQALDCANNLVCSSNDNCSCIKTPLVAWVSPTDDTDTPNGAVGNFITIGGSYFGTSTGQVIFMGDPNNDSDDKVATFPNQINPLCTSFWQDNQIIAVVPAGAVSGPIKVIDSNNYYDTTDNDRGARVKDFLVNSLKRPGLCDINPSSGGLDDKFNLQGSGFNALPHSVFFGTGASAIVAKDIIGWTNTSVNASVPNIKDSRNSVFIRTNNINSNDLVFTIINNANANPAIEYIEPDKGPAGQYITIYGRNFKTYNAQKSSVKFYLPADPNTKINADIDFPEACKNSWWHDTYIVVKVPKVNSLGAYKVEVTNTDSKTSLPADFTINNETPTPGLCLLNPNNGPVGWPVAANGERFGNAQGTGRVQYFNNKDGAVRGWTDKKVDSNVPLDSTSGPFRIIDGQGYFSNPLPFRVGKCSANSECETGEECCGGGTYWSGICRATGTCAEGSPTACGFGWT